MMREPGVVLEIADGVLNDRMPTVVGLHGQQRTGPVGEDRVIREHHIQKDAAFATGARWPSKAYRRHMTPIGSLSSFVMQAMT